MTTICFLIQRSWNWRTSKERKPKTENSAKKVPMNPVLEDALLKRKEQTPYKQRNDFVFPSVRLKGKKPLAMMEVFKRKIKPVIRELSFMEPDAVCGWHAFRHGMGTALWDLTRDKLTVRDLLRHGTTTMTEKYTHGIDPRLVEAQNRLVKRHPECAFAVSRDAKDQNPSNAGETLGRIINSHSDAKKARR